MDEMLSTFARAVQNRPDNLALFDPERRFSFSQFSHSVDALAHILTAHGACASDVIAWLGPIGLDCTIVALATQKAGLTLFAPNLGNTDAAIRQLLKDANAKCVVVDPACMQRATDLHIKDPILFHADPDQTSPPFTKADVTPETLSNLTHTSGSTGELKLIAQTRASQAFFDQVAVNLAQFKPSDVQCVVGHLWPAILFSAIRAEVPIGCFDAATHGPRALVDWMNHENISTFMGYPALFRQIIATDQTLPSLRFVMLAGEPVSRRDLLAFNQSTSANAQLLNSFGAMEFPCLGAFTYTRGDPIEFETLPMGTPIQPDLIHLITETGDHSADGEIGEIEIRSQHLPDGYLNGAEADAGRFKTLADGQRAYRTGDLAIRDSKGVLHSMGRADQQVKIRGYNVRLNEIEAAVTARPDVTKAAVVTPETSNGIRRIECHFAGAADPLELADHLRTILPNYMMPARFHHHAALPMTVSGKIRRNALLKMTPPVHKTGGADWQDATEVAVRDLMIPHVGHDAFSPEDDFFDLGGDSLQAMTLLLSIERAFRCRLPFESFVLNGASARALASKLNAHATEPRLTQLKHGTSGRTIVLVPNIGGDFSSYVELMHAWGDGAAFVGVHPKGMHASDTADNSISAIAEDAVDVLLKAQTEIEAVIGYSSAGPIAYEMACCLKKAGRPAPPMVMLDPVAPWEEPSRLWRKLRKVPARVIEAVNTSKADVLARLHRNPSQSQFVETHLNALAQYRPLQLPKSQAFLMTVEESQADIRSAAWADVLDAGTTSYTSRGNHSTAMQGPNAVLLAHRIQDWLAETRIRTDRKILDRV